MHSADRAATRRRPPASARSEARAATPRAGRPRTLTRIHLLLASALLLAAAPGCASKRTDDTGKPTAERARTTVRVENRSFLDHNVFVLRGGQRIRLGTVTGNSSQTFTIPANLIFGISSLQFLVDPIGGNRQPISNEIRVSEGDEVQLVIPPA